jgi:hypothetical protein
MESISTKSPNGSRPRQLRLTVAISNYNYGHYLPAAVDAMVNQSRPADEIILIDDASTDGSLRVVDELARRYPFIKVVRHESNRGANATAREAFDLATGDYFYMGSADDMVLPGFFESAMTLLEQFPGTALCAGFPVHWNEDTDEVVQNGAGMPLEGGFLPPAELVPLARQGSLYFGAAWTLIRVADLKAMGGFKASLLWLADWFPIHEMAFDRGICWTGRPTAVFRIHSKSYSRIGTQQYQVHLRALTEMTQLLSKSSPEAQKGFKASGVLGRWGTPMLRVLLSDRRYWSQISWPFVRIWFGTTRVYRAISVATRFVVPKALRSRLARNVGRNPPAPAMFDVSTMRPRQSA